MHELIDPVYLNRLKRMTPAEKLQVASDLYCAEIRRRTEVLRRTFPDWSEDRLDREARRSFLHSSL